MNLSNKTSQNIFLALIICILSLMGECEKKKKNPNGWGLFIDE